MFCDMANALISMGYSVTAICLDKNQGAPGFNISSKVRFINAYQGGVPLTSRSLFKNLRSLAWDRAVRHKKRSEIDFAWKIANINSVVSRLDHVDLYVSFQPVTTHFLAKCKDVHAPIITMLHGVPSSFKTDPIFEYYRDSVEKASALTVLMPDFVQSAREMFRAVPIAVIPNAICQFERSADLNERKVVCVARMSREKRVELMLKAFSIIKDSYDEWVIEFWGEVDYDPEYRDEVLSCAIS